MTKNISRIDFIQSIQRVPLKMSYQIMQILEQDTGVDLDISLDWLGHNVYISFYTQDYKPLSNETILLEVNGVKFTLCQHGNLKISKIGIKKLKDFLLDNR